MSHRTWRCRTASGWRLFPPGAPAASRPPRPGGWPSCPPCPPCRRAHVARCCRGRRLLRPCPRSAAARKRVSLSNRRGARSGSSRSFLRGALLRHVHGEAVVYKTNKTGETRLTGCAEPTGRESRRCQITTCTNALAGPLLCCLCLSTPVARPRKRRHSAFGFQHQPGPCVAATHQTTMCCSYSPNKTKRTTWPSHMSRICPCRCRALEIFPTASKLANRSHTCLPFLPKRHPTP